MTDEPGLLPAVPDAAEVAEVAEVAEAPVDGEIVGEPGPGVPRVYVLRPVVQVFQAITIVVRHEHTRTAARHAGYVPAGAVVLARRRRQRRTQAQQMAHQLAAQGETDRALAMLQQAETERHRRHERARGRVDALITVARNAHWIALAVTGAMLALGIAAGSPAWPFRAVRAAAVDARAVLAWAWRAGVFAVPAAVLAWLHEAGRRAGDLAPGWSTAAARDGEERGLVVTADAIVVALAHMPVTELKRAFRDGWAPVFHTLPVKDGEGYFSVFSLPMGVTAEMIANHNDIFARNLHRARNESWPTDAERDKIAPAGYVALWVANPGVLDRPAPEWPLLHEGTADVFRGVPAGVSPRGDAITVPVVANNSVFGGLMGQGKSNACRVVMLGAALDPLAELRVHVFAYNGDFDAFGPRLSVYRKGAEEDDILAAMAELEGLYAEVSRREQRISGIGAKKVTRQIAERYPDLRPILTLFSECHELFGHKEYGEEATALAVAVIRKARKCAMWMGFDTQDARKDAIPQKLVGLVSVNACFYVKGHLANDGFLGAGSYRAGIRATELRPGRDIGRSLVTGVSAAQFEILKWHYIYSDDDTGQDDAAPVIARAMAGLAPGTTVAGNSPAGAVTVRDLLDDLGGAITGPERVKVRDAVGLLRGTDPLYPRYRQMTAVQLREALLREGVRTVNASGTHYLDPADLRRALAERDG